MSEFIEMAKIIREVNSTYNAKNIGDIEFGLIKNVLNKFSPWMVHAGKWCVYSRTASEK